MFFVFWLTPVAYSQPPAAPAVEEPKSPVEAIKDSIKFVINVADSIINLIDDIKKKAEPFKQKIAKERILRYEKIINFSKRTK